MYLNIANATNSAYDDISYFTRERPTGEVWINAKQLYTKTVSLGTLLNPGPTTVPHGITGIMQVVSISGVAQDANFPASGSAYPIPYASSVSNADSIDITVTKDDIVVITSVSATLNAYVTLKYTKS